LRGNLFHTTDNGDTWEKVDSKTENSLMGAGKGNNGRISIVGTSGVIVTSANGGRTFNLEIRDDRLGISSVSFTDDNNMILVGEKGVEVTGPDGKNL
jgi:photosystem II stability/assembly factor-like uncharacterized protein